MPFRLCAFEQESDVITADSQGWARNTGAAATAASVAAQFGWKWNCFGKKKGSKARGNDQAAIA